MATFGGVKLVLTWLKGLAGLLRCSGRHLQFFAQLVFDVKIARD